MNLVEPFRRIARQQPGLPALIADGRVLTYGDLLADVASLAAWLDADGVRAGHRVAVYGNATMRIVSTLALGWIGAVSIDTSGMPEEQLGELAEPLGLDAVYSPREVRDAAKARVGGEVPPAAARAAAGSPPPLSEGDPDDLWRIMVSSGTTGRPKGIACTHRSLLNVHLLRTVYPSGAGDVVVLAMNPAMSLAVNNWLRCLYSGACVQIAERMRPPELLALMQSAQPTHCMVIPSMANAIADLCVQPNAPVPAPGKRLRAVSVAGGRVSAAVREAITGHVCANFISHYGSAEAQIVAVLDPELARATPGCSGRLMPWIEAQAIGEDGGPLPPGEAGRLRFRSPALAAGYIGHPDGDAFQDGWFVSQDRGAVGVKGLLFVLGRTDDVINLAGRKLDPEMMEEAILSDHAILECAVVDVPGATGQELAAVIVTPAGGIDRASLVARCAKAVPGVTLRHVVRAPRLPRNQNGKIVRDAVRRAVEKALTEGGDVP